MFLIHFPVCWGCSPFGGSPFGGFGGVGAGLGGMGYIVDMLMGVGGGASAGAGAAAVMDPQGTKIDFICCQGTIQSQHYAQRE